MRDKGLSLYGEKYFLPGADVEFAVRYFKKQRETKNKKWWPHYHDFTQLILHRVPNKGVRVIEDFMNVSFDDKFIEKAASILAKVKEKPGFMSNDNKFNANLERLLISLNLLAKNK